MSIVINRTLILLGTFEALPRHAQMIFLQIRQHLRHKALSWASHNCLTLVEVIVLHLLLQPNRPRQQPLRTGFAQRPWSGARQTGHASHTQATEAAFIPLDGCKKSGIGRSLAPSTGAGGDWTTNIEHHLPRGNGVSHAWPRRQPHGYSNPFFTRLSPLSSPWSLSAGSSQGSLSSGFEQPISLGNSNGSFHGCRNRHTPVPLQIISKYPSGMFFALTFCL